MVMNNFKEKFVEYISNLPPGTKLITYEIMNEFLKKFQCENPFLRSSEDN